MAFQFASTNLVIELGIILVVLIGWQFVAAEFAGGLIMIVLLTVMLRAVMTHERIAEVKRQADRGLAGRMEGHAAMDMSVGGDGSILARVASPKGFTAISHYFVVDWAMIRIDIALGLLIAGALAAWVPKEFWQAFFLSADPVGSKIVGPLIGPIVAIVSFVCSVRNVPLAVVLWKWGHQLRRRCRVPIRRSDCAADPRHLPALLRAGDRPAAARGVVRRHGGCGLCDRSDFRDCRAGAAATVSRDCRGAHHLELYDLAQHRVPRLGRAAGLAFSENGRAADATNDESTGHS
jgi:hypothetical protein